MLPTPELSDIVLLMIFTHSIPFMIPVPWTPHYALYVGSNGHLRPSLEYHHQRTGRDVIANRDILNDRYAIFAIPPPRIRPIMR